MNYVKSAEHMIGLGLDPTIWTNHLIVAEALARKLRISKSPKGSILISDGQGKSHYWRSGATSWNSTLIKRIARHKNVCNSLLNVSGVRAAENARFSPHEMDRAWKWGAPLGKLVLKPSAGYMGKNVHVNITAYPQFERAYKDVADATGSVLVEKFYEGVEHRCLVIRGKFEAATRRRPASVKGDGKLNIKQLIDQKNANRGKVHQPLTHGPETASLLAAVGLKSTSIPERGSRIYLRHTSNLHQGGDAIAVTDTMTANDVKFVEHAARSLPGANLIGLDVLLAPSWCNFEPLVIEVNTSPMISMHHFPWAGEAQNVTSRILDEMFPESR